MSCRLESNGHGHLFRVLWTQKRQSSLNSPIGDINEVRQLQVLQSTHRHNAARCLRHWKNRGFSLLDPRGELDSIKFFDGDAD